MGSYGAAEKHCILFSDICWLPSRTCPATAAQRMAPELLQSLEVHRNSTESAHSVFISGGVYGCL